MKIGNYLVEVLIVIVEAMDVSFVPDRKAVLEIVSLGDQSLPFLHSSFHLPQHVPVNFQAEDLILVLSKVK